MKILPTIFLICFFLGNNNILRANWGLVVSYQSDNRGYHWDDISTSPLTGIGISLEYQIFKPNNQFAIIAALEYLSQRNSYEERDPEGTHIHDSISRVKRLGIVSYARLSIGFYTPYIGIGGGIEQYDREFIHTAWSRIDWVEKPTNRSESNPYFYGVAGVQLKIISYFNPFIEFRYYNTSHSNQDFDSDRNKIKTSFTSINIGLRLIF